MFDDKRFTHPTKVRTNIPDLKQGEVYISHIGDGEYDFNVFGQVYDDLVHFWKIISDYFKVNSSKFNIVHYVDWNGKVNEHDFFIELDKRDVARLTIEKVNPNKFETG